MVAAQQGKGGDPSSYASSSTPAATSASAPPGSILPLSSGGGGGGGRGSSGSGSGSGSGSNLRAKGQVAFARRCSVCKTNGRSTRQCRDTLQHTAPDWDAGEDDHDNAGHDNAGHDNDDAGHGDGGDEEVRRQAITSAESGKRNRLELDVEFAAVDMSINQLQEALTRRRIVPPPGTEKGGLVKMLEQARAPRSRERSQKRELDVEERGEEMRGKILEKMWQQQDELEKQQALEKKARELGGASAAVADNVHVVAGPTVAGYEHREELARMVAGPHQRGASWCPPAAVDGGVFTEVEEEAASSRWSDDEVQKLKVCFNTEND